MAQLKARGMRDRVMVGRAPHTCAKLLPVEVVDANKAAVVGSRKSSLMFSIRTLVNAG